MYGGLTSPPLSLCHSEIISESQIKHISLMLQNLNKLPRFFKVSAQISRKHEYDTKMIERNC